MGRNQVRKTRTSDHSMVAEGRRSTCYGLLVEDNQLQHIRNAKGARDAWDALKGYHQKVTLTSKVLLLKRLCRTVLKETCDMEKHITTMAGYFEKLAALDQELLDNSWQPCCSVVFRNHTKLLCSGK